MPEWTRPAVGAVLRLHRAVDLPELSATVCAEDRQAYPCGTVALLRGMDPLADPREATMTFRDDYKVTPPDA